ncbi:MAG TPA: glycerate dehydrogenase [Porticoccaceae bacterium]|nr:glycerate dehydrogenase [Porticoccaceae bacterium]
MTQYQGVILDRDSLHPDDLDLGPIFDVEAIDWRVHAATPADKVPERITEADIVLTNKVPLRAAIIESAKQLKYIGILATGTNVVDLAVAHQRGIITTNITNYGTPSVAQHTFALILALSTRLLDYAQASRNGRWSASSEFCLLDYPTRELTGLTLGIIGYGTLGKAVADIGKAFGMNIMVAALPGHKSGVTPEVRVPLDEFLTRADVVSIHCPLTDNTRHLIGRRELGLMKRDALLINCARGGIVEEEALASALKTGEIAGAALDVLSEEPPPKDHVLLATDIPNLVITPHCAWGARESRQRLVNQAGEHLRDWLALAE